MSKNTPPTISLLEEKPYLVWSSDISFLEGQLLTFIEATIADPEQRKAAKDMLTPLIWQWANRLPKGEIPDTYRVDRDSR